MVRPLSERTLVSEDTVCGSCNCGTMEPDRWEVSVPDSACSGSRGMRRFDWMRSGIQAGAKNHPPTTGTTAKTENVMAH
jgi:hypothetical protein